MPPFRTFDFDCAGFIPSSRYCSEILLLTEHEYGNLYLFFFSSSLFVATPEDLFGSDCTHVDGAASHLSYNLAPFYDHAGVISWGGGGMGWGRVSGGRGGISD